MRRPTPPSASDRRLLVSSGTTQVRVVRRVEELDDLAGGWDLLSPPWDGPTTSHAWARACTAALLPNEELWLLTVGPDDQPSAIAPLVLRRGRPGRMELLGARLHREPIGFLYTQPSGLSALTEALARSGLPLALDRIPAGSAAIPAMRAAYRGRGLVVARRSPGYPFITLHEGWNEPETQFNRGRRSDFRRAGRRAEGLGSLQFEVLSPAPEQVPALLDEAYRVEAAGWKGRAGTALARDPALQRLFDVYAAEAARLGILRLCFLRVGGRAAAMQIGVEWRERFWVLKIGHDEEFSRCSPGALLMLHTVGEAAARGLRSFELLGKEEPWTAAWTHEARPLHSLRVYPFTLQGAIALAADGGRFAYRRARQRLRSG